MSQFHIDDTFPGFRRDRKKALKKYPSIKNDIKALFTELESEPTGWPIPGFARIVWKKRMGVKGHLSERDGYRLIYHVSGARRVITPLCFYPKAEREDMPRKDIQAAVRQILASLRSGSK